MRADKGAFAALDADRRVPDGDLLSDVALLPLGGADRPGAVRRKGRNRQHVPLAGHKKGSDPLDEFRGLFRHHRPPAEIGGRLVRHLNLMQVSKRLVHRLEIPLDDLIAFFSVGLTDALLDCGDCLLPG
ncbi:MAG: hypothetical protein ACD_75C02509G0003 [uncultured bacterium]|nr:MAG: hypothetical protein ACD_75C02509G0003 [uncultured bacterium]